MFQIPDVEPLVSIIRGLRDFLLDPLSRGEIVTKNKNDFVTAADKWVQHHIKSRLCELYPTFAFLGEEEAGEGIDPAVPTWVLDPIDGTTNYIFSYGLSAVSLGLVLGGRAVLGIVYNPYTDECFHATRGGGAYLNGRPIRVDSAKALADTIASVGTSSYYKERSKKLFALAERLYLSCIDIRRTGSCAIDLCYVAAGRVGVYAEYRLQPWDFAAGSVILSEAGGTLSDWEGNPVDFSGPCNLAASNTHLHDPLLAIISDAEHA